MKKAIIGSQLFALILAVLFLITALGIAPLSELTLTSDAAYPILIAVLSVIFAVWIFFDEKKKAQRDQSDKDTDPEKKVFDKDVLVLIGLMLLYAVLLFLTGYVLSTLVFTTLSIIYLYKRDWKTGLLIGFISTFMIVLVFKYIFSVILP